MSYFVGQEIRNYGTFQTADGTAYDPGTVRIGIARPGGTLQYIGSDVEGASFGTITRQAVGTYYADVILSAGGYWARGWEGSGTLNTTVYDRIFARYQEPNR